MLRSTRALAALLLALPGFATPPQETPRFPASTALAEEVSPEGLVALGELVQGFVDDDEVVGAELMVIKNGRTVLHEAYGWRDREEERPMEPGGVFCVRSMTKPLIGASIRMLIEEDLLDLDTPVGEYLPSFAMEGREEITVEQLLTHTSGLPMSYLLARDLTEIEGIGAVAELVEGHELEFDPGTAFRYSDQGTDTLTALIEAVTGGSSADFVRTRLLEPLGMDSSACVLEEGHPLRERACSKYVGSTGAWRRFWQPSDPPLFPFFLGSQGMYSTLEDYARFVDLYLNRGRVDRERLLRPSSVRKTLTPGPYPLGGSTSFPEARTDYGNLMQLWTREGEKEGKRELVAFGHTGSDGTHAWAFPEQRAMVLYFTQSRGTLTGLRVEEALGQLLLGAPYDPIQAAPPLEEYLGYYREDKENDLYRAIVRDGDDLALEIVGKAVVPLTYAGNDSWKLRPQPGTVLAFDRDENGRVTGYHIGDHQELRFEPDPDLPSAAELAKRVAAVHRLDLLETLGPLHMHSRLDIEKLGITGEIDSWLAWPDRWRVDESAMGNVERTAYDGTGVFHAPMDDPPVLVEGSRAAQLRVGNSFARFGDWNAWYDHLEVIQRLRGGNDEVLLVRAGDTSAPAATFYVDARTYRLGRVDDVALIDGMGRVGQRMTYNDFRDLSGMLLPYEVKIEIANPMIGTIVAKVESAELGVELEEGLFELRP